MLSQTPATATTYGFIGLGLIGGSIARAIRKNCENARIVVYDICRKTLQEAADCGVADITTDTIDGHFAECNYVFLCAPVQKNNDNLLKVKEVLSPDCLISDVGSVKREIHETVASLGLGPRFIGGHPMAGSERVGFINSKSVLLENAYYILTPTKEVPAEKTEAYRELVKTMGAIPLVLDYQLHDYVTAAVSHLPHIIASSLVNLVRDKDSGEGIMKMIAAGGFKDITRIASSSAPMWQQICLNNTENIAKLLSSYIESLNTVKTALEQKDEDALYEFFHSARLYRDSFINASSGPIKRSYTLNLDIADEPGALASIAAILALHEISIKNIGIVHNREFEGGILKIEFYEEEALAKGAEILKGKGYAVNQKE